jgi:uncharacterized protein YbjT (DUF2867 family)
MTQAPITDAPEVIIDRELPTRPLALQGKVLVTGASGYIGGRLVPVLVKRGYGVRVMVRAPSPEYAERWPTCEIVVADALESASLLTALQGVHTAYYLIHSMLLSRRQFAAADRTAAQNFRVAAAAAGVKRIIYLGGLGDLRAELSTHLRSRMDVADELTKGPVPTTVLRAAIIVGSGSASYELMKHLVQSLPLLPAPPWARTRCQPIGIRDVITYLVGVLETESTAGGLFDIGGKEVHSYKSMLRILADVLGRRMLIFDCPFPSARLCAYFGSLLTPVPQPIVRCLFESSANEVVCQNNDIQTILPFATLSYRQSIVLALTREEQDEVHSRWSDAYPPAHELALRLEELHHPARYTVSHRLTSHKDTQALFKSICSIGGREGWFHNNWLWRLRGVLDRILMGVGSARGRRQASRLRINDVVDFWRVEDLRSPRRLLLRAEMKLPGRGWLEFRLDPAEGATEIRLNVYFDSTSLAGRLYWYACVPLHWIVFRGLLQQIERRS